MSENSENSSETITLVLIVKSVTQFDSVVQFLKRRGWRAFLAHDLEEAVKVISKTKPQYVLISFNHPNKNLLNSPEVFARTFGTTCVGMTESADLKTESRLTASKIQHKLMGAASGPSIHRKISQIHNDVIAEKQSRENARNATAIEQPDEESFENDALKKDLEKLQSISTKQQDKGFEATQSRVEAREGSDLGSIVQERPNSKEFNLTQESIESKSFNLTQEGADNTAHSAVQEAPEQTHEKLSAQEQVSEENLKPKNSYRKKKDLGYRLVDTPSEAKSEKSKGDTGNRQTLPKRKIGQIDQGDQFFQRRQEQLKNTDIEKTDHNKIQAAIEKAVSTIAADNKGFSGQFFRRDKVGVIPATINNEQGFFVVELGINQDFDETVLTDFKAVLEIMAKEQSLNITLDEVMLSKKEEYNLRTLVEGKTKFEFRKKIESAEVFVGFVPMENDIPEPLSTAEDENMSVISTSQIFPETDFLFDAFLYLEKNEKFFKYGKEGRYLSQKQIQRLTKRKHSFYIRKEDINKFKAYYAANKIYHTLASGKKKKAS